MGIWPVGKLQNLMLDLQDHFEALLYILGGGRTIPDWLRPIHPHNARARKVTDAEAEFIASESLGASLPTRDARFRIQIAASSEWTDLELLFRTLAELQGEPLMLSMPIDVSGRS